jgi:hypothetical protein
MTVGRYAFGLLASLALWAAPCLAQTGDDADKIYERLSKLPPDAEIEVLRTDGTRLQGVVERFNRGELVLAGLPQPIPLSDIRKIKRIRTASQRPVWNPATGFVRSWKMAAIAGGMILALALLVAYGTE